MGFVCDYPVVKPVSLDSDAVPGLGAFVSDYSKGAPYLSTKIIFILSGGSKREKDYFKPLKADKMIRSIKIAFRSKNGQGLKPYELNALAAEFIKNKNFVTEDDKCYRIEDEDIIYLLQDVDEFSIEVKKYLCDNATQSQYKWIVSNPSFEIWLFYHYFDTTELLEEGVRMSERDRSNWLKERLNTIVSGGVKTTQALYGIENAIANSSKNYVEENCFPKLYSTQMHIVAKSILSLMKSEFHDMKTRQEEKLEYYKRVNLK